MSVHSGNKSFTCTVCHKKFMRKDSLKCHMRSDTGEKPYACTTCEKRFSQRSELKYHMINHHPGTFRDDHNEKLFSSDDQLVSSPMNLETMFVCPYCAALFKTSSELESHKRYHSEHKPFSCSECPKRFGKSWMLRKHMLIHSDEKHFICQECNKTFRTKNHLIMHVMVHTGEKPIWLLYVREEVHKSITSAHSH